MNSLRISIVIPTLNEAEGIGNLVKHLKNSERDDLLQEIIVVDGGSKDDTQARARAAGAKVVVSEQARRSSQMNCGAAAASGDILYFLHADVTPPPGYLTAINDAVQSGHLAGCFRRKMAEGKRSIRWITTLSQFRGTIFRGGDASMYMLRDLFGKIGGFDGEMVIMEDFEVLKRLRKHHELYLIPEYVTASDRKHQQNQSMRVHFANGLVMGMYLLGFSQKSLVTTYRRLVDGTRFRM